MPFNKLVTNTIKINRINDEQQALLNDRPTEISAGTIEHKWDIFL